MGNNVTAAISGLETIADDDSTEYPSGCSISEFEHTFPASLEDASSGTIPEPLAISTPPSTGPPDPHTPSRPPGSSDTNIDQPISGRLITAHMLETELVLREMVGLIEENLATIPYSSIRRLTWDHSRSSVKVGHGPVAVPPGLSSDDESDSHVEDGSRSGDPDALFVTIRVENSLQLEDELKQRARAEARRARFLGQEQIPRPSSIYLGVFAGYTKPKPFQRRRPNLSFTVPDGELPSLKDMRRWSLEEHWGSARPQLHSLRPKLALDSVLLGENRFPLTTTEGLNSTNMVLPDYRGSNFPAKYTLLLMFGAVEVVVPPDCGANVKLSYEKDIDDWDIVDMVGQLYKGIAEVSGIVLWVLDPSEEITGESDSNNEERDEYSGKRRRRRVFLGVLDEDLLLARSRSVLHFAQFLEVGRGMEYFWNSTRAKLKLPPKAASTHGRCAASMLTLRGEVKSPALPTGRVDPVDLNGVEVRIGQVVQTAKRTGQLNLLPSPRALLGVEKRRLLRYNAQAKEQWERVVLHQGWLRKRGGGAVKRWVWRYFVLYDTPQGHFLAYYNDVSDIPLFCEDRNQRKMVDLCQVCFLRPEFRRSKAWGSELPPNAFTLVTTERFWTLCADSQGGVLQWLRMLSVAIDEDVAVVDDGETLFHVKAHWAKNGGRYGPESLATVRIGSMGMELQLEDIEKTSASSPTNVSTWGGSGGGGRRKKSWGGQSSASATCGGDACAQLRFWGYTDFFKWTLAELPEGNTGLTIQCFADDKFMERENILLVTPKAAQLALVIEHRVEKFMALMHLRLELPTFEDKNSTTKPPRSDAADDNPTVPTTPEEQVTAATTSPSLGGPPTEFRRVPSMNMETNVAAWGRTGLLLPEITGTHTSSDAAFGERKGNPFDSSSDEEKCEEGETDVGSELGTGTWGAGGKSGIKTLTIHSSPRVSTPEKAEEVPGGTASSRNNPFDFPDVNTEGDEIFGGVDKAGAIRKGDGSSRRYLGDSWGGLDSLTAMTATPSSGGKISPQSSTVSPSGLGRGVGDTRPFFFSGAISTSSCSFHPELTTTFGGSKRPALSLSESTKPLDVNSPMSLTDDIKSLFDAPNTFGDTTNNSVTLRQLFPSVSTPPLAPSTEQGHSTSIAWDKSVPARNAATPLLCDGWPPSILSPGTEVTLAPTTNRRTSADASIDMRKPIPLEFDNGSNATSHTMNTTKLVVGTSSPPISWLSQPMSSEGVALVPTGLSPLEAEARVRFASETEKFNPFANSDSVTHAAGKVIHESDSLRVVMEQLVQTKKKSSCSISLRYELQPCVSGSPFCVDLLQEGSDIPLMISLKPDKPFGDSDSCQTKDDTFHQEIVLTCIRPFSGRPGIAVTWPEVPRHVDTNPQVSPRDRRRMMPTAVVPLPVTIANFVEGLSMTADAFRQKWSALSSPNQTVQSVVQGHPLNLGSRIGSQSTLTCPNIADVIERFILGTLGLTKVLGLTSDGTERGVDLLAAAGVLRTAVTGGEGVGDGPSVGCLVGVECKGKTGVVRVTAKSANHALAVGVLAAIVREYEAMPGLQGYGVPGNSAKNTI